MASDDHHRSLEPAPNEGVGSCSDLETPPSIPGHCPDSHTEAITALPASACGGTVPANPPESAWHQLEEVIPRPRRR